MKIRTFAKLGDICDVSAGQGAPQGDSNYCDNGTPFVKAGNLIELIQGKKETEIQKVSEDVAKKHKLKKYPAGSLLFAKSGMSCMKGYVYQLKNDSYVVSHLAIVKPKKDSSDYIEYCLRHIKPNSLVKDEAYPSISLQDISNLEIPLPSLEEQVKIADQLSKCTQIINKHKEQLEKYDFLIKSRFIEMFGDPVTNPKGWEIIKLADSVIALPQNGMYKPQSDYVNDLSGIPILRIDGFYEGKISDWGSLKRLKCSNDDIKKYHLNENDIVINRVNSIEYLGKCAHIQGLKETTVYESNMMRMHFDDNRFNPVYVTKLLCSNFIYGQILNHAKKAVNQASINQKDVLDFDLYVPPLPLQNNFAAFVQQIDKSKFAVQKSLEKTETLYKSLMQKYFS